MMTDEQAIREAMQQQAIRLRDEYGNLEEIRSVARPMYNKAQNRVQVQFTTPAGIFLVWWDTNHWKIEPPGGGNVAAVKAGYLREALRVAVQNLTAGAPAPPDRQTTPQPAPPERAPAPPDRQTTPQPTPPEHASPPQAAMEEMAARLRKEYSDNLEELGAIAKPVYNQETKRVEVHFDTTGGIFVVWWDDETDRWKIMPPGDIVPEEDIVSAYSETLRFKLGQQVEDTILATMQHQRLYLRNEFDEVEMEALLSWAKTVYDYDLRRPEIRFDTPGGICRVWMEHNEWHIRLPDGTVTPTPRGLLRDALHHTRQLLNKGSL
jgi:hypothetical protein